MPQKKSAKTLFELCVDKISEEIVCGSGKKIVKHSDQGISFNAYEELPTSVFEEVICGLERKLLEENIRWIITLKHGASDLSIECYKRLSILGEEPIKKPVFEHLQCAFIRYPLLKNLKLPYRCLTNETLVGLLPSFINLQELNISRVGSGAVGDKCLWILGTHCKHLRYLNVNYCIMVTDFGIQGLCIDYLERENDEDEQQASKRRKVDHSGMRGTPARLSNSLQTLCLKRTQVTKKGIQEALQKLRSLRILKHASTVKVLGEMHNEDGENNEISKRISKYALSKLKIYNNDCQTTRNCLWKALSLCPLVTALNIGFTIENFLRNEIYTDGYIDSILCVIGNSLEELSLKLFQNSKIRTIIDCCPNLRILKLCFSNSALTEEPLEFSDIKERKTLKKLEELAIYFDGISPENLITLMSSSSLKSLKVDNCDTFTDDILQKTSNLHLFSNLEHLDVWMCDFVTEEGINVLLQESNPLKRIRIYSEIGKSLTKEKVEDWKLEFALKNWQLDIQFYEVTTHEELGEMLLFN